MGLDILAVTGARSDWGLMAPVLTALRDDPAFTLRLAVTGQHLIPGAASLKDIIAEGFSIDHRVDLGLTDDDSAHAISAAAGAALAGFGAVLAEGRPDILLVLGDRYETFCAAAAAMIARVPIAHLCGGDVTEGAIDEAMRHGITKMAHLHFVTNADAARRVAQLGEDPARVHNVGSPGLDRIDQVDVMDRNAFFRDVGLEPRQKNALVTFHPVTLAEDSETQHQAMLDALALIPDLGIVFTGSNADPGGRSIDALTQDFVARHDNAVFIPSLGSRRYFAALRHLDAVIGNSSSGLCEAPSFGIATVNIGDRQKGRPRARSVIDCEPYTNNIADAVRRGLDLDFSGTKNPYGDGHAAVRIVAVIKQLADPAALLHKHFWEPAQ